MVTVWLNRHGMRWAHIEARPNIEIRTLDEARRFAFPGSPTVRVDGEDVLPDPGPTTAVRSSSMRPVASEFTRGMTGTPEAASCGR